MHPKIKMLEKRISEAERNIEDMEKQMTMLFPEHPKFIALQQSIESLQDSIAGWAEQAGDLEHEDALGINGEY